MPLPPLAMRFEAVLLTISRSCQATDIIIIVVVIVIIFILVIYCTYCVTTRQVLELIIKEVVWTTLPMWTGKMQRNLISVTA